jgi:hypothetical protein
MMHTYTAAGDYPLTTPIFHASPTFVLCAPPTRGRFDDRRATRALRTDARRGQRAGTALHNGSEMEPSFERIPTPLAARMGNRSH